MNELPDATLLRRYTDEGDEAAFTELVQRYLGRVYHAALRQTNSDAHAAEDVAQTPEPFLRRTLPETLQKSRAFYQARLTEKNTGAQ